MGLQVTAAPETLRKVRLFALLMALILVGVMAFSLVRTGHYVKTEAMVQGIDTYSVSAQQSGHGSRLVHEVTCSYVADGQLYEGRFRTLMPFLWRNGRTVAVRYQPDMPQRLRDPFLYESGAIMLAMAVAFVAFTTWCLAELKKQKARQQQTFNEQTYDPRSWL